MRRRLNHPWSPSGDNRLMRTRIAIPLGIALCAAVAVGSWVKRTPLPPAPVVHATVKPVKPTPKLVDDYAVPVLMYHRIDTLTEKEARSPLLRDLTVSPEDFESQVKYLADNGFTFLCASDVDEAVRLGHGLPEKAVCITMDDGYSDNFDVAYPILKKYNAKATIFVVTSSMGKPARLSWANIGVMHGSGLNFASHTVTHADLTALNDEHLDFELKESRAELERHVGEKVQSIAYPSGAYDDRVIEHAEEAGYWAGWRKGGGPVMPGATPMMLPRVRVNGNTSTESFQRKVWSGVEARAIERERVARRSSRQRKRSA